MQPKPSCFTKLFKGSSSSNKMGTMLPSLKLRVTSISWELNRLCSTLWRNPWMQTLGFAPSNPNFLYWWCHVLMQTRRILPCNNFVVLLAFGGISTLLCSQLIILSPRTSSKNAFRAHHIPQGLMERRFNEFLDLTQGTDTVLQYAQKFNNLC